MGGVGSGGLRVGAGRKPKNQSQHWLGGDAGKRGKGKKPKTADVMLIPAPRSLDGDARDVWSSLAPHACAARTLTDATVRDFAELCELVVEMESARVARRAAGWNGDGLRLAAAYRGLVQRVEAKMRAFRLAPIGKEMTPDAPTPDDPFDQFEGGGVQ